RYVRSDGKLDKISKIMLATLFRSVYAELAQDALKRPKAVFVRTLLGSGKTQVFTARAGQGLSQNPKAKHPVFDVAAGSGGLLWAALAAPLRRARAHKGPDIDIVFDNPPDK